MSFTVVIPAHNRAHLVERAVASALAQTEPPTQILVVDDGSTDTTADVAAAAGATVIRLAVPGGSGPARNAGVRAATTDWIAFLDSDDEWRPDHLATLRVHTPDHVLVSSPATSTSGDGRGVVSEAPQEVGPAAVFAALNPIVTSGTAVRTSVLLSVGGFRPLPRAQDFDCWLRVLEQGRGLMTGRQTVRYHEHEGQASRDGDLNRACILRIVADASQRPWCDRALRDRVLALFFFNDIRHSQRGGDRAQVVRSVRTLLAYPGVWPSLFTLTGRKITESVAERREPATRS